MKHLDDLELLTPSGDEARDHLLSCGRCRDRADLIAAQWADERRGIRDRAEGKPESFWLEQRAAVRRRLESDRRVGVSPPLVWALVAALVISAVGLALTIGNEPVGPLTSPVQSAELSDGPLETFELEESEAWDPWQSDELQAYHQVVEWESWIEEDVDNGGRS